MYINEVDGGLRSFVNLQILVLSANNIRDLSGGILPRKLRFLELYNNFISDIEDLVEGCPKGLRHLGLGRNRLNDDSSLHLLTKDGSFSELESLDLSDNDICDLQALVSTMQPLKLLSSLQLEGNPCYVQLFYKTIVLGQLPKIKYFDRVKMVPFDSKHNISYNEGSVISVLFNCYRIIALHPPPRDKKHIQTIHVEVELPLLEKIHARKSVKPVEREEHVTPTKTSLQNNRRTRASVKSNTRSSRIEKIIKKPKKHTPYDNPDEHEYFLEEDNFAFKTVRLPWSRIMEFPPVRIDAPDADSMRIRDTFRTCATVRVVYLKVKPTNTNKKTDVKHTKSSKDGNKNKEDEKTKEVIVKRLTLYKFKCNLRNLNWSDESLDFYWADHPQVSDTAFNVDGCLKNIVYGAKEKHHSKATKESISSGQAINKMPKIFTCQVGFGMTRPQGSTILTAKQRAQASRTVLR